MKILILIILSCSAFGQLMSPTFTPSFSSGRAMHGGINLPRPIQVNPQRMIPFRATPNQQTQPQQNAPTPQPLRAINNRYPKNNSNIMGFRSYERINLKDHKKRAEAAKIYKEKLSTLRISLRAYRVSPPAPRPAPPTVATNSPALPITPPSNPNVGPAVMPPNNNNGVVSPPAPYPAPPTIATNRPALPTTPPPNPNIRPAVMPINNNGVSPPMPRPAPPTIATNSPAPSIAIGMPAPQPRQLNQ